MSYVPTLKQKIVGKVGAINVRIRIEVGADKSDALANGIQPLPTLAEVQNTMVLLIRPVYSVLGLMEIGGLDALVNEGPRTPPTAPPPGKVLIGDFSGTRADTENGKGD